MPNSYKFHELLFKNREFFLGFLPLALLAGYALPSTDFYELMDQAISYSVIPRHLGYVVLICVALLDFFFIWTSLINKYAVPRQATLASALIFFILAPATIFGFWLRLRTANLVTSYATNTPYVHPRILPTAISVAFTLSLFSLIYGIAAQRYLKMDYTSFQDAIALMFRNMEIVSKPHPAEPPTATVVRKLKEELKTAIEALKTNTPYETGTYGRFVRECLLDPLEKLNGFFGKSIVEQDPTLIVELHKSREQISYDWIKEDGYASAYKKIALIFGRK